LKKGNASPQWHVEVVEKDETRKHQTTWVVKSAVAQKSGEAGERNLTKKGRTEERLNREKKGGTGIA